MNKQDKELLLKDLCARLPYGVKTSTYIPHIAEPIEVELTIRKKGE